MASITAKVHNILTHQNVSNINTGTASDSVNLFCQIWHIGGRQEPEGNIFNVLWLEEWAHKAIVEHPILDTRISVLCPLSIHHAHDIFPLDSETGWTGEFWSKTNLITRQTVKKYIFQILRLLEKKRYYEKF